MSRLLPDWRGAGLVYFLFLERAVRQNHNLKPPRAHCGGMTIRPCRGDGDKLHLAAGKVNKLRHLPGRMQDHVGIADSLYLATVQTCRIAGRRSDDVDICIFMVLSVGQHLDHAGIRIGIIAANDLSGDVTIDDPVLQAPAMRSGQSPDAMPDAVQIACKPAIMMWQPVLDSCAKPLRQNRRKSPCRDRQDHRIAIDNRTKIEAAERRIVGHIHRHPRLPRAARQTFIKVAVSCINEDQRPPGKQGCGVTRRHTIDVPHSRQGKRRRHRRKTGDKVCRWRKTTKKTELCRQPRVAANHKGA